MTSYRTPSQEGSQIITMRSDTSRLQMQSYMNRQVKLFKSSQSCIIIRGRETSVLGNSRVISNLRLRTVTDSVRALTTTSSEWLWRFRSHRTRECQQIAARRSKAPSKWPRPWWTASHHQLSTWINRCN